MPITVYRSTDASAPTLDGTAGSLITLLDAILVNGYGAKAAVGWTKEYSGTNKAAYRTSVGTNQFYFQVLDNEVTNTRYATVNGYESMSDVDTGANPFPNGTTQYIHKSSTSDAASRDWVAASDGNMFHIAIEVGGADNGGFSFGDFQTNIAGDVWNTLISATSSSATSQPDRWYSNADRYIARSADGLTFTPISIYDYYIGSSGSGSVGPSYDGSSIPLSQMTIQGTANSTAYDGTFRGTVPGIYNILIDIDSPLSLGFAEDTFTDGNGDEYLIIVSRASYTFAIAIKTTGEW